MGDVALSEVTRDKSMSEESMVEGVEKVKSRLSDTPFSYNQTPSRHYSNQSINDRHYDVIDRSHKDKLDSPQRILFVTTEITDFVKVGGLGDVSSALPAH
ncbi:hypothetical protein HSBAA_50600 [Vreelandella sulfidaeris]|uniref:starch synthase n=1 Tax=Vreelandella sulfidaeris TaxID=115553 RepID=A0A455ULD2_9GAMM|nr:hypothetical protein HSBAA_50600 [Halomonas sulfidaeris]